MAEMYLTKSRPGAKNQQQSFGRFVDENLCDFPDYISNTFLFSQDNPSWNHNPDLITLRLNAEIPKSGSRLVTLGIS